MDDTGKSDLIAGICNTSITLPVSTRSIGFYTQAIFKGIYTTNVKIPSCTIWQLYRVSLAQFENKVSRHSRNSLLNEFTGYGLNKTFTLLAHVIDAVGNFTHNDNTYHCYLPCFKYEGEPEAHLVSFSNLRSTVEALSNPNTSQLVRLNFYKNSPLPGAIWGDNYENPILMNPDEIMPSIYDSNHFQKDIGAVYDLITFYSWRKDEVIKEIKKFDGNKCALVSNYMNTMSNPERYPRNSDEDPKYNVMELPKGDLEEFWAHDNIKHFTAKNGIQNLVGEIPYKCSGDPYSIRALENCCCRFDRQWLTTIYSNSDRLSIYDDSESD